MMIFCLWIVWVGVVAKINYFDREFVRMPLPFFLIASKKLLVSAEAGWRKLMLRALSPPFHKWLEASEVRQMSDRDDLARTTPVNHISSMR